MFESLKLENIEKNFEKEISHLEKSVVNLQDYYNIKRPQAVFFRSTNENEL